MVTIYSNEYIISVQFLYLILQVHMSINVYTYINMYMHVKQKLSLFPLNKKYSLINSEIRYLSGGNICNSECIHIIKSICRLLIFLFLHRVPYHISFSICLPLHVSHIGTFVHKHEQELWGSPNQQHICLSLSSPATSVQQNYCKMTYNTFSSSHKEEA